MIEILNAVHNIVSVDPENLPERLRKKKAIYYSGEKDVILISEWDEDTKRIGGMIADYLELSPEGKQKAEEFCISSGSDYIVKLNDMLKEIARIRQEKGRFTMRTDEIRIFPCFAAHEPKPGKMQQKEQYFEETGALQSQIILDSRGNLIDGYTSYLLARAHGIQRVPVRYGKRQIVKASHKPGGKLYSWELPGLLAGRVHPGDKVTVQAAGGFRRVAVAAVEEYAGNESELLKMVVRKGRMRRR